MLSLTKNEQGDRQVGGAQSSIGVDRDIKIEMVHLIQKENAWRFRDETGASQGRVRRGNKQKKSQRPSTSGKRA